MQHSPNTVLVPENSPFELETIILVAERNRLDSSLIELIENTFEQPEISRLVRERNLPMPDAFFIKAALVASLEWHIEGIAYEITFINFGNGRRVNPGTYEISTGAYTKPLMPLGKKGVIEIINRIAPSGR